MGFEKISKEQFMKDVIGAGEDINQEVFATYSQQYDEIKIPKRKTKKSAGYDFFAPHDIDLNPGDSVVVKTGIKADIPDNTVLELYPRSGHGFKFFLRLANTVGIIDGDYYNNPDNEGHILVKIRNEGGKSLHIDKGSGFCQGIIKPFITVDEDEVTSERLGGFGSTDKK